MLDQKSRDTAEIWDSRQSQVSRSFTAADFRLFVRLRRMPILACIGAALALAYGYNQVAVPSYTARAQIIIDPRLPQFIPGHNEETVLAWDSAQVESEIAVLMSERIAGAVVTRLGLDRDKDFRAPASPMDAVRAWFGVPVAPPDLKPDRFRDALFLIQSGLIVKRAGLSYAIDISFSFPEAFRTSAIANAVAESYIADQIDNRAQAARVGGEWLQGRMVSLRSQMNAASQAVQIFRGSHNYSIARTVPATAAEPGTIDSAGASRVEDKTLDDLEASASTYKKIYESFLLSYTESVQRQSFPVSDARLLTPASIPKVRSAPRAGLVYALAGLMGSLVGIGIAVLHHNTDRRIRSSHQIVQFCGLDDFGRVPRLRWASLRKASPRLREARDAIKRRLISKPRWWQRSDDRLFLASLGGPATPFGRALMTIKALLELAGRRGTVRCIGVTAAHPGAGSTMIASNIASIAAACGKRTLLIDADASRQGLTRQVGADARVGLMDVLANEATLDEAIVPFNGTALSFLPIASERYQDLYDLNPERLEQVLQTLADRYALVIVDLPPLIPVGVALDLCMSLDGVLLTVEWGRSTIDDIATSVDLLNRVQARTLGFVLNKTDS